jgi:nucleotidyltransferase-like protein
MGYNGRVGNKRSSTSEPVVWYRGAHIPMRVIREYARRVAERFQPERIILFGSYAYGQPHADSDVDILVVMPARNEIDQSARIDLACDPCFPMGVAGDSTSIFSRFFQNRGVFQGLLARGAAEKVHGAYPCRC